MNEELNKPAEEKPLLSYSRLDEKPLLHNQAAISAAVEHLNKHNAFYYEGLPEFEADQKFKDYYNQEYGKQPEQKDIQEYVDRLILECIEEDDKEKVGDKTMITTSLGESFEKILEEEEEKDQKNS